MCLNKIISLSLFHCHYFIVIVTSEIYVHLGTTIATQFTVVNSMKQGEAISPSLFNIYMHDFRY